MENIDMCNGLENISLTRFLWSLNYHLLQNITRTRLLTSTPRVFHHHRSVAGTNRKNRSRLWLGSYRTPEQAARAFDAAVYCLRGTGARCNFPGQLPDITPTHKLSPEEIRAAAMRFARDVPTRPGEAQEGGMETSTETAVPNKGNSATVTGLLSADKPIPAEKRIGAVQLANEGEKTAEEVDQGEGSSGTMVKPPEASKELPWPWNAEDEDTWPAFSYDDDIYESSPLWNFRSAD